MNGPYDLVRNGDIVVVEDKRHNERRILVTYFDGDYDFSVSPATKSVTMLNGYTLTESGQMDQPVVWRQDSDGGRILSVNGYEPGYFRLDGERA